MLEKPDCCVENRVGVCAPDGPIGVCCCDQRFAVGVAPEASVNREGVAEIRRGVAADDEN